jgi:hypothetical protein
MLRSIRPKRASCRDLPPRERVQRPCLSILAAGVQRDGLGIGVDTVGEFISASGNPGFASPARLILHSFRPNDAWREFADSIRCYSSPEVSSGEVPLHQLCLPLEHRPGYPLPQMGCPSRAFFEPRRRGRCRSTSTARPGCRDEPSRAWPSSVNVELLLRFPIPVVRLMISGISWFSRPL